MEYFVICFMHNQALILENKQVKTKPTKLIPIYVPESCVLILTKLFLVYSRLYLG